MMQDARGVKQFHALKQKTDIEGSEIMNCERPRSTFWYFESQEQSTFKLKGVVAEWLDRADAMAQLTENNIGALSRVGVLSRLATRLRIMFKVNPSERGTIKDCWRHLRGDEVPVSPPIPPPDLQMPDMFRPPRADTEQDPEAMIDILNENNSGGDELGYIDGPNQAYCGIPRAVPHP